MEQEQRKPRPDMIEQIKELTNRRLKVLILFFIIIGTRKRIVKANQAESLWA
jgi:hypothetical protein